MKRKRDNESGGIVAIEEGMGELERKEAVLNNFVIWVKSLSGGNVDLHIKKLKIEIDILKNMGKDYDSKKLDLKKYENIKRCISILFSRKSQKKVDTDHELERKKSCLKKLCEFYGIGEDDFEYIWNNHSVFNGRV